MSPEDIKEDDFSQSYNDILLNALDASALSVAAVAAASHEAKCDSADDEPSSSKATTIRGESSFEIIFQSLMFIF